MKRYVYNSRWIVANESCSAGCTGFWPMPESAVFFAPARLMRWQFLLAVWLLAGWASGLVAGENVFVPDQHGRVHILEAGGARSGVFTDVRVFPPGWTPLQTLAHGEEVEHRRMPDEGVEVYSGKLSAGKGLHCSFRQTIKQQAGGVHLELTVSAAQDVAMEGVFFWIDLPVALFADGWAVLENGQAWPKGVVLPKAPPWDTHILNSGMADAVVVTADDQMVRFRVHFNQAWDVQVQDDRKWGGHNYGVLVAMHKGNLAKGKSLKLTANIVLERQVDRQPVDITLIAGGGEGAEFAGIGGNFCYGLNSPLTSYIPRHLRTVMARAKMSLDQWEPVNDNADAGSVDWDQLRRQDRPGSELREEFRLLQDLTRDGRPLCISVWDLPEWMYAQPRDRRPPGDEANGREVKREMWPELIEGIVSYLTYLKRRYRVEPELFSFNEPDIGVRVRFTATEYADFLSLLAPALAKAGLGTRLLLGDVSHPRGTTAYLEGILNRPAVLQMSGAVGFHTWNGATAEQYRAWSELAGGLKLPLLVTEAGTDPEAWKTGQFKSWHYAVDELKLYFEVLKYARPKIILHWEFTADYAIAEVVEQDGGAEEIVRGWRFWFLEHLANLTPEQAVLVESRDSHAQVMSLVYRGKENVADRDIGTEWTIHIANFGTAREAVLTGLPETLTELQVFRSDKKESFRKRSTVAVQAGTCRVSLPDVSLTTLLYRRE